MPHFNTNMIIEKPAERERERETVREGESHTHKRRSSCVCVCVQKEGMSNELLMDCLHVLNAGELTHTSISADI